MKNLSKILASISLLFFLLMVSLHAQSENRVTRGQPPLNPKWTVIIDYVDSFDEHKDRRHGPPAPGEEPPPPVDHTKLDGHHYELIGGRWGNPVNPDGETVVVHPNLVFYVDLRGFPDGSDAAIEDAFDEWQWPTLDAVLVQKLEFQDVILGFDDGFNTYSMRNLGGGGVLAATFITWDDLDGNSEINDGEPLLEMDVIHNTLVKWGTHKFTPRGKWQDVRNVATHELGHVFGLAHPGNAHEEDQDQTMFASAPPEETTKQDLELNGDVKGMESDFLGYVAAP
jgi:hypothetical protein